MSEGNAGEGARASGALVQVEGLKVRYGRKVALDGVRFEVPAGSVYALLGRNGAGKTSLIRCLVGGRKADAGRAWIHGFDAWKGRVDIMERTGIVPEEPDAPPDRTAWELAALCARLYGRWDAAAVAARLERYRVPLGVPFGRLSKGQKGLVMLSLALGHSPALLILDDPTLGLDAVARRMVLEEIVGDLADRGTTILVATHDLDGIEGIADRVGILRDGRLAENEEMETLRAKWIARKGVESLSLEDIFLEVAGRNGDREEGEDA